MSQVQEESSREVKLLAATMIERMLDRIEQYGWRQGLNAMLDGPACIVHTAVAVSSDRLFAVHYKTALYRLRRNANCTTLADWNDEPGRTRQDVIDLLARSAMELREEAENE